MATIRFIWDGHTAFTTESTIIGTKGSTAGNATTGLHGQKWTGIGLTYTDGQWFPTGGTLTSFEEYSIPGEEISMTGLNLRVTPDTIGHVLTLATTGQDTWTGDDGNNVFIMTTGGDSYFGGGGIDTVDFIVGTQAQWLTATTTLTRTSDGVSMRGLGNGSLSAELHSVERVKFSDVSVAFDLDGNAGAVLKLLGAVFGPSSITNYSYVGIGLKLLDGGMRPADLAGLALGVKLGGGYTNAQVVDLLYTNVIGTHPTTAQAAGYVALLDSHSLSPAQLTTIAADTAANMTHVGLVGQSAVGTFYIPG